MSTYRNKITRYTRYIALLLVVFITTSKVQASESKDDKIKNCTMELIEKNPNVGCATIASMAGGATGSGWLIGTLVGLAAIPGIGPIAAFGGIFASSASTTVVSLGTIKLSYEACKKIRGIE